jgi:hypothetical protein
MQSLSATIINAATTLKKKKSVKKDTPRKRFIAPRIITLSLTFKVLHNDILGYDGSQGENFNPLFDHEGYTDDTDSTGISSTKKASELIKSKFTK